MKTTLIEQQEDRPPSSDGDRTWKKLS